MIAKQLSQVATSVGELRNNKGNLPATVHIPGRENINEISLRSGKTYQGPPLPEAHKDENADNQKEGELRRQKGKEVQGQEGPSSSRECPLDPVEQARDKDEQEETRCLERPQGRGLLPAKPYPFRGMTAKKKDTAVDAAALLKDVEVKIPLLQALKIPSVAKFVKDFMAGKVTEDGEPVNKEDEITHENISAVTPTRAMPSKQADPGIFTLPISIDNIKEDHAVCDLGASINVLPYSLYKEMGEPELVETDVVIQLADKSCIYPEGILEDVSVKINNFIYPADFFIIKMNEPATKESSGVLLGRPFLSTAGTVIDVNHRTISLDYHGEKCTFNLDESTGRTEAERRMHSINALSLIKGQKLDTKERNSSRKRTTRNPKKLRGERKTMKIRIKIPATRSRRAACLSRAQFQTDQGELVEKEKKAKPAISEEVESVAKVLVDWTRLRPRARNATDPVDKEQRHAQKDAAEKRPSAKTSTNLPKEQVKKIKVWFDGNYWCKEWKVVQGTWQPKIKSTHEKPRDDPGSSTASN